MKWELEWGSQVEFLEHLREHSGVEPKALRDKPTLSQWNAPFVEAWARLKNSRPMGQGAIGHIPLSEMASYLSMMRIDGLDEKDRWVRMISALDSVYVEHINKKLEAERKRSMARAKRK